MPTGTKKTLHAVTFKRTESEHQQSATEDTGDCWGPKTAKVPDTTVYSSPQLRKAMDDETLPKRLTNRAWQMLEKRVNTFGFNGRLGHLGTEFYGVRTQKGVDAPVWFVYSQKESNLQAVRPLVWTRGYRGLEKPLKRARGDIRSKRESTFLRRLPKIERTHQS